MKEYNPKKALQLLKEAGYKGEPITVLAATDHNTITPATQVLIQAMREAGINVDAQSMDWGSVVTRRANKNPPAQGGWNIFVTTSGGVGSANPVLHTWIGAACDKGLFGWPCDPEIEKTAQCLRHGGNRGRAQEDRQGPADPCDGDRWSTCRSASGTRRSPTVRTRSTGSCPTPAWRCCGASRRNDPAGSAAFQCRSRRA